MARKLLILMATAALVALAGACGSSEEGNSGGGSSAGGQAARGTAEPERPTAVETVRVAYRETAAEQTAKTSFEATTTGPAVDPEGSGEPAPMTITMTGEGVTDFSGGASSITMEMFGMGSFEMRQVGKTVYMRMPEEFLAQMPGAKPWMRIDADAMYEQQYGASPGQMQGGAAQDPTRQLEYLRGVSDSVEKVGQETVRGARTTHYRATIDLKKAGAGQDAEVQRAHDQLVEQLGATRIPVGMWLDAQNRVRRFAMDMTVPVPEGQAPAGTPENAKMRTQMVVDYYDFGTPVNVQKPLENQTMDGSKLLSGQQPAVEQ